jgi:DNA-binding response OmpR family regulator
MAEVTVLVVDDDPVIMRLLEVNFEMEGYTVLTATDGQQALDQIASAAPDLVVCDIMMPVVNGLEVVERLRQSGDAKLERLPVILLSAKAQASEVQKGLDVGADDYITKPFDPLELIERVQALLQTSQSQP